MLIRVKVKAGAKRDEVVAKGPDAFAVSVREKAERNEANGHLLELMAEYFGVPERAVRIVRGHKTPSKILDIMDAYH